MKEILRFLCFIVFNTFYRVKVINRHNIPAKGGAVLCANHVGELDMFVIGFRLKRLVHWMAKEELFKNPLFSAFIRKLGSFPVKRGKPDVEAIKKALSLAQDGHIVGIFPEGTRTRNKKRGEMKISRSSVMIASKAGVPIVPVAIKGSYRPFSKVEVIFGQPFILETADGDKADSDKMLEISKSIMESIYLLLDAR